MPAALIVGAFGQDNPGDEALLASSIAAVQAQPGWDPVVVTSRPDETAELHQVEALDASATVAASGAVRADALVVGGGTVFKELHGSTGRAPGALLRRATALAGIFHARRRPVALIGVGAAPIDHPGNRRLARALAHRSDLLVLRDAESAHVLTGMGVTGPLRVGADLAWIAGAGRSEEELTGLTGPPTPDASLAGAADGDGADRVIDLRTPERAHPDAPRPAGPLASEAPLGVAVSHLAGDDAFLDRLAAALRGVARSGVPVELEPWQGSPRLGPDAVVAHRLQRHIGDGAVVVPPPDDLGEATERMARRCAVVAMRFHATVAAAEAGTPFVAVTHEPKLEALARRAEQPTIGLSDGRGEMAASIYDAVLGAPPSPEMVVLERQRARATIDLLGLVLTGAGQPRGLSHLDLVPEPTPA
ncbi:MAG TPA: polysaccharide pyruvyl transferase family protein [Acidimicrobiales bacterium]|nr:polysaccharide pyruvyl transferase family protein [Acidimicrobiales bacterium]